MVKCNKSWCKFFDGMGDKVFSKNYGEGEATYQADKTYVCNKLNLYKFTAHNDSCVKI